MKKNPKTFPPPLPESPRTPLQKVDYRDEYLSSLDLGNLAFHPLADLFPLLEGKELDDLVADIKKHGLMDKIVLFEGQIIDGRNRYNACKLAGKETHLYSVCYEIFEDAYEEEDPANFVYARNILRRHLKPDQRAYLAADLYERMEKRSAGGDQKSEKSKSLGSENDLPSAKAVKEQAAKARGVSKKHLERASALKKADPALAQQVKTGKKTLAQAEKDLKAKKQPQQQTAPKQLQAPATAKTLEVINYGQKCRYQIIDPLPSWHAVHQANLKDSHQFVVCTQCWTYSGIATVFGLTGKLKILQAAQPYRCECECKDSERHATKEEIEKPKSAK